MGGEDYTGDRAGHGRVSRPATNLVSGYLITNRMLAMFKRREEKKS
jgi:hypothetical protein